MDAHDALIRQQFTKQADAYASNPTIIDSDWSARLVASIRPTSDDRVLEVATGPGYVALAFAAVAFEVVGVDLTDAPLAIARKNQSDRRLTNVSFRQADAKALPWPDESFDVVVCRLAYHHFESPTRVLSEMARVCRSGGKVAVEDMIASEQPVRAEYYNHWERLRDPSHVDALSLGQLVALNRDAELEIDTLQWEERTQDVERWLRTTETAHDTALEVRRLIQEDASRQISGTPIFDDQDGRLCFKHRMVTIVGRKA
jgi:ubiquinone/menaquinone biosynthesis C-methylase UbiE